MITLHYVATLLLFTATAVSGQTVLPSQGCSVNPTWNRTDNTNVLGGTSAPGITLDTCQQQCASNNLCSGVDWDANTSPGTCYLILSPNAGAWRVGQAAGVTHYQLLSRGDPGCIPAVCYSWELVADMHVLGGIGKSASSLDSCQSACIDDPLCVGIDYDQANPTNCYLTHTTQLYSSPGVKHYNLIKTTGDNCSAGCIFYSPDTQAVLTISGNIMSYQYDLLAATVFLPTRCLIDSSWTMFSDCYSYQWRENSDYYLRAMAPCTLSVHRFNESTYTEKFPQRFYQDASFVRHTGQTGFSLETVSIPNYFVSGTGGLTPIAGIQLPPLLYCVPAPLPSTSSVVVRDSCPLVWNRIRGTMNKYNNNPSNTNFEVCRQRCIIKPFCVGINFVGSYSRSYTSSFPYTTYSGGRCDHIEIDQRATAQQFQPTSSSSTYADYYELQRTMPGTCRSGCRYSWSIGLPSMNRGVVYDLCASELDCRLRCIKYSGCVGVGFDGTQWTFLSSTDDPNGNTPVRYILTRISAGCGRCVNHFSTVYNAYDSGATSVGSSYTDSQCRTVCVNNRGCVGYELRDNNACYISRQSNTLTPSPVYNHVDIIRPGTTCGNGCVHDWEFSDKTSMEPGTNVVAYSSATTDRACRAACISNPQCTGIDWVAGPPTACWLGLSANIQINYGKATQNTYHFELKRDSNCDE